jgi:tetratricopeptide (TPR) repeat protein
LLLEAGSEFNKNELKEDAYLWVPKTSLQPYSNTHLVRASLLWKEGPGVTHAFWSPQESKSQLKSLFINDANIKSMFERDIKMLQEGLEAEPNNDRYMFYLAQSYMGAKQYDEAIKWYTKHVERGGWQEEVWYSKFMLGECCNNKKDWNNALQYYLESYQLDITRAEPLQKIANHYRYDGKNQLAYFFAKQGKNIPYPKENLLFVTDSVYDYQFDEELSIASYYTPFKEDGLIASNNLILKKGVPHYIKDQAYRNILFYVHNLKNANIKPITFDFPLINEGRPERYVPMNPSIQKTEEGYKVICRTVNYLQHGARNYQSIDGNPTIIVRTKNVLLKYDKEFNLLSQNEIRESLPRKRFPIWNIEGLEDCRLFELNNQTWFTCTTLDTNPNHVTQISLCKLSEEPVDNIVWVESLVPLKGPDPRRHEKNWLPFVKDNAIHIVYSTHPFILYKPNIETGENETVLRYEPTHDLTHLWGSAAPLPFDEGYLMLNHENVQTENGRIYLHRFVFLDKDFKVKKLSLPFTYMHAGVEYCPGMTIDHAGKNLIMTIGNEDREAYIVTVDLDTIRNLLMPLP